jgi:hypothetical protein
VKGDQFLRKAHLGAAKPDLNGPMRQILVARGAGILKRLIELFHKILPCIGMGGQYFAYVRISQN